MATALNSIGIDSPADVLHLHEPEPDAQQFTKGQAWDLTVRHRVEWQTERGAARVLSDHSPAFMGSSCMCLASCATESLDIGSK